MDDEEDDEDGEAKVSSSIEKDNDNEDEDELVLHLSSSLLSVARRRYLAISPRALLTFPHRNYGQIVKKNSEMLFVRGDSVVLISPNAS